MKKTLLKKTLLLLFTLLAGVGSAHAEDFDYEWVKITDLSDVQTGDNVVLVDETNKKALSHESDKFDTDNGYDVTISDGKITITVPAYLQWTLTKGTNNTYSFGTSDGGSEFLCGDTQSTALQTALQLGDNNDNRTNSFFYDNYDSSGGRLYYRSAFNLSTSKSDYCCVNWNGTMFNAKWYDGDFPKITLYKRTVKNYVKWKRIDSENVNLEEDAVIAVVDLKSERALSNDKADKDPDAVAVTLNDDKDRILGEVPEKVQWIYNRTQGKGVTLKTKDEEDDKYLYADTENKGLKVGDATGDNQYFSLGCTNNIYFSLWTSIGSDAYLLGVEESMFSNTWKLIKPAEGEDIDLAFFKKIEDSQRIVTIELPEYYNYDFGKYNNNEYTSYDLSFDDNVTITGAEKSEIKWKSSNTDVIEINEFGYITQIKKRGTAVITAYVEEDTENYTHDKASAKCTVIIDDSSLSEPGSTASNPLSVADAKKLAEEGEVTVEGYNKEIKLQPGVNYYIKGKVSKVNSGMMAMFGDMDFGEMMGSMGDGTSIGGGGTGTGSGGTSSFNFEDSMDDMDFDMEDMEDSGFDMSSMGFDMSSLGFDLSAMFGTSDKVTYYISDDGTKDGQMKVVNGCGTLKGSTSAMEFNPIPKLSPGDCVVVCGPLVYTEDTSMFSGMIGGNSSDEPKKSGKVDEMNYLAVYDPTLLVEDKEIYVNKTLESSDVYSIDNYFDYFSNQMKIIEGMTINEATFKSSDEEIAKWDEDSKKIVGVNEGKAKITVKVKVILQDKTEDQDERSYTMKRKFKLIVKTRDLDPAGYYDGDWVLTTSAADLKEGTRLVLAGTRVKEGKEDTDYMMVENNAMMGGGKNGSKIEFDANDTGKTTIPSSTVISKGGLEVVLEKADENGTSWYLNVGEDETGAKLYLYASVKKEEESTNNGNEPSTPANNENEPSTGNGGGFNMDEMMEMFSPSSGMKVGTIDEANQDAQDNDVTVSLKATISFTEGKDIAIIKFDGIPDDYNNTIMLSSSFDMEEMMGMFGGMGGNNNEEEDNPDEPTGDEPTEDDDNNEKSTFDMGSFDMFMASFNTKKPGDETPETGKEPKNFMPRIYRFVPDASFDIAIGDSEWKTIVSYKDVQVPENVEAYIVTEINQATSESEQSLATLSKVENLKGGAPYLLHTSSPASYTMNLLNDEESEAFSAPTNNKLKVSDRKTSGEEGNSKVYVLANKNQELGTGFYQWIGGDLGSGRVYLPVPATTETVREFVAFGEESTAIQNIESTESRTETFYDLQGRRVNNPTNGIYIVNGKKAIIK